MLSVIKLSYHSTLLKISFPLARKGLVTIHPSWFDFGFLSGYKAGSLRHGYGKNIFVLFFFFLSFAKTSFLLLSTTEKDGL